MLTPQRHFKLGDNSPPRPTLPTVDGDGENPGQENPVRPPQRRKRRTPERFTRKWLAISMGFHLVLIFFPLWYFAISLPPATTEGEGSPGTAFQPAQTALSESPSEEPLMSEEREMEIPPPPPIPLPKVPVEKPRPVEVKPLPYPGPPPRQPVKENRERTSEEMPYLYRRPPRPETSNRKPSSPKEKKAEKKLKKTVSTEGKGSRGKGNSKNSAGDSPLPQVEHRAKYYPRRCRRRNHQGVVFLQVEVDQLGEVAQVIVVGSKTHTPCSHLVEAAVQSVLQSTFRPAIQGGRPVTRWTTITYRYRLHQ